MLASDLAACSDEQREFFVHASVAPCKWHLDPWGDEVQGVWVVAVHGDRVLWYNDVEEGFNVSRFDVQGEIPRDEYCCNQDSLRLALQRLQGEPRG